MFGKKKKEPEPIEQPQDDYDEFNDANEERKIKKGIKEKPKETTLVRAVSEADMLNILAEKIDLNTKYLAWIVEYIKRNQE